MLEDNHWVKFCDLAARLSSHLWQIVTSIWSHYSRWPSVGISRAQKISAVLDDYKEHNCRPLSSTSEWLTHNFNFARGGGGKNWRRTFSKKPGDTHAIAVTCVTITRSNTETIWKVVTLLKFAEVNQDVDFFYLLGLEALVAAKRNAFVFHTGAILSKKKHFCQPKDTLLLKKK